MIKNTQIYKLLDDYDALPSQESWKDLDNNIREKFREFETMFTEGKSEQEIKTIDDELVQKFNSIYGDTDEKPVAENEKVETSSNQSTEINEQSIETNEKSGDKKEEVIVDKVVNKEDEVIDTEQEAENKEQETENDDDFRQFITTLRHRGQETNNQKQESGNVVENIENQNNEEMENMNNDENIQVTTETENEAAKMLEELEKESNNEQSETNNQETEQENNENQQTEQTGENKQEPEPHAEFIQFAKTQELISAKHLLQFNIPPELWHEDKEEIKIGSLVLRKTDPSQLMFNKWTVIKQ